MRTTNQPTGKTKYFVSTSFLESPSMEGAHYAKSEQIPLIDAVHGTWKNKKTGETWTGLRTIRYIPGEDSIFDDEQSEAAKKVDPNKRQHSLWMHNGILIVKPLETKLLEYLEICNYNASNTKRDPDRGSIFQSTSYEKVAEKSVQSSKETFRAQKLIFEDSSFVDKLAYATVLGINTDREMVEIEFDLIAAANKNPDQFIDGMHNPLMKKKFFVLMAIRHGVYILNSTTHTIMYPDGNVLLQGTPGVNIVDQLTKEMLSVKGHDVFSIMMERLAMVNPQIASLVKTSNSAPTGELQSPPAMKKEAEKEVKAPLAPKAEGGLTAKEEALSPELKEAITLGVITKQPPAFYLFRENRANGAAKLQSAWDTNTKFQDNLKADIAATKVPKEPAAEPAEAGSADSLFD